MRIGDKDTNTEGQGADGDPYALTRYNATRHGLTSRHALLPWENPAEFEALRDALVDEHQPNGATEQHLVDQLAALFWRQQRVLQAECAEIRDELRERLDCFSAERIATAATIHIEGHAPNAAGEAIRDTDADAAAALVEIEKCEKHAHQALAIINRDCEKAYSRAFKALHADTREWWTEELEEPENDEGRDLEPTASALREFLTETVLPFHAERIMALRHRHLFRSQAFGMAVKRADLERLGRYETTLDRKLQRILGMLLQLQGRRRTLNASAA